MLKQVNIILCLNNDMNNVMVFITSTFHSSLPLVIDQKYTVQVHDEYVILGNTAVLKCQVPSYVSDYVVVTAWILNTGVHLYPNTDIGGKYNVISNGDLYITNVGPNDAHTTFLCRTTHRLTGEIQQSTYPSRIIVTGMLQKNEKHAIIHHLSFTDMIFCVFHFFLLSSVLPCRHHIQNLKVMYNHV